MTSLTPCYLFFSDVEDLLFDSFRHANPIHTERWQSIDISKMPNMAMRELLHYSFALQLPTENLQFYRDTIKPNLPWADDHFKLERVSGQPINPGVTYQYWTPGQTQSGQNASSHLRDDEQFDHSYAERYWPKFAGLSKGGILDGETERTVLRNGHSGVRFYYGDLDDLVYVLANEPLTRQAYLPVWFPEDLTASKLHKRVPCTLGYHFIMRNGAMDVTYYIRSCDYARHFRDDVYLTIRLLLWVLEQCRLACPEQSWDKVQPGRLTMHITSFHMFEADHKRFYRNRENQS